jgi:putative intracellular protease/amidase
MYKILKTIVLLTSMTFFSCGEKDETKEDSEESETSGGGVNSGGGGGGQTSGSNTPGSKDTTIRAIDAYADKQPANGKKVLMVVAQNGFYFKEYNDPRMEIEGAGYAVDVASVSTSWASPHLESGQRENEPGSGGLIPDLALSAVDPANYEAVVFAGGWGASMYYYAYEGQIANATWNRNDAAATRVNELIGLFLASNKHVVGVCNGVNILSWARVNDVSPLSGKNATAPDGGAPGQTYLGATYNDNELVMSKFATDNGATLVAPYTIGDVTTASDDVVVDGLLITAQNQFSAQEAGRKLVELLAD